MQRYGGKALPPNPYTHSANDNDGRDVGDGGDDQLKEQLTGAAGIVQAQIEHWTDAVDRDDTVVLASDNGTGHRRTSGCAAVV